MELGCARAQNQPLGCTLSGEEEKRLEELGQGTVEFTPSWESGGSERALAT